VVQIIGIVEDALARVTGNDLVVLADFLKHLGANTDLTDFADVVTRR
jgi:hypothetical protein